MGSCAEWQVPCEVSDADLQGGVAPMRAGVRARVRRTDWHWAPPRPGQLLEGSGRLGPDPGQEAPAEEPGFTFTGEEGEVEPAVTDDQAQVWGRRRAQPIRYAEAGKLRCEASLELAQRREQGPDELSWNLQLPELEGHGELEKVAPRESPAAPPALGTAEVRLNHAPLAEIDQPVLRLAKQPGCPGHVPFGA